MTRTTISKASLVVVALGSLGFYVHKALPLLSHSKFDDAYMFLRYAKHWLSGAGVSWNQSDGPVYGITSLFHLLLVTAVRAGTDLPDPLVLTLLSFSAGLAAVAVLTTVGFVCFGHLAKLWIPLLLIPFMVLGRLFGVHSATGMETTLALLFNSLLVGAVARFATRRSVASMLVCLVAAYASYLARPDAGLYCLLLPPLFLVAHDPRHWRRGLAYVGAFTALLCVDLFLKHYLFGNFLPLPFHAKSGGFYRGYLGASKWNPAREIVVFARDALPYVLVVLCFMSRATRLRVGALILPMTLTFGYFTTVTQIMGSDARYYYPSLPFLVLAAFVVAESHVQERSTSAPRRLGVHPVRAVLATAVVVALASPLVENVLAYAWRKAAIGDPASFRAKRAYPTQAAEKLPRLGWWRSIEELDSLLQRLPSGTVLAASEHGFVGSRHPTMTIIDLVGLHDRTIALGGFSAAYVISRKPDLVWLPHPDYSYATAELLDSGTFAAGYDYYPNAYDYGVAIRRSSETSSIIHAALEAEFSRLYPGQTLSEHRAETE